MKVSTKQERSRPRTVDDLMRRYDLEAIVFLKQASKNSEEGLNRVNAELEGFVNATLATLKDMQNQIDGNITTYFYKGEPSMTNVPANEWTTDELKKAHLGDLYYDQDTGYAYRFALNGEVYEWSKIVDNDVVEALALANAAQDTADGKRRVFTDTPSPPYDKGDLWIKDREIYICLYSREDGEFASGDFGVATKYTDDTRANEVAADLAKNYSTTVAMETAIETSKAGILAAVSATYTTKDALTEEITAVEKQISSVSVKADGISTKVSEQESSITGLTTRVSATETSHAQLSDKFNWIVKTGTNASDFTITDRMASLTAQYINLNGLVTFSGLDSSAQNKITAAESNAASALSSVNNSVKSVIMHYLATSASTGVTTSTSGWTTTVQSITSTKKYLWTYQTITTISGATTNTTPVISGVYGDTGAQGATGATGSTGATGTAGVGVAKVVPLYYLKSNTTAPNAPTAVVTSTSTSSGVWTTAVPTYVSNYTYFTCTQTLYTNGTYGWSTVVADNALTNANKTAATANTNASTALTKANSAYSTASANDALLAQWCHKNDKTLIDGGKIYSHSITTNELATDSIKSINYVKDKEGSFLNLEDGTYDSQFLKWNSLGTILDMLTVDVTSEMDYSDDGGIYVESSAESHPGRLQLLPDVIQFIPGGEVEYPMRLSSGRLTFMGTEHYSYYGLDGMETSGEIISTSMDAFRMVAGNYGAYWRFDGTNLYLLFTNSGDQYGTYNSLRPLTVNVNGGVTLGTPVALANNITLSAKNASGSWCTMAYMGTNNYMYFGTGASERMYIGNKSNTKRIGIRSAGRIDICPGGMDTESKSYSFISSTANDATSSCFRPTVNAASGNQYYMNLGSSSYLWYRVYATGGVITSSDRRLKNTIQNINDKYLALWDKLSPKSYYLNSDNGDPNKKKHLGFIAQDIEDAILEVGLTLNDCYLLTKDRVDTESISSKNSITDYNYSLNYDQLSVLTTAKVKQHEGCIRVLEGKFNELQEKLEMANAKIEYLQSQHLGA